MERLVEASRYPPTLGIMDMLNAVFISEAARILAIAPETLRLWEKNGRLHAVKIGRGIRLFNREDVERLARERSTPRAPRA